MNRRKFLTTSGSCSAHLLSLACVAPSLMRNVFAAQTAESIVVEEKWGRLEKIHEGAWALISTPFTTKDFTTVCNGGIIAGDKRVLAIESFMSPKGARWLAEQAQQLTGKWPTDIVSTHYHADHTAGHLGYHRPDNKPRLWLTEATKVTAEASFIERKMSNNEFQNVSLLKTDEATLLDLGNRRVKLVPRSGHTASDMTVELVEPKVVWCGDLFFNRMFPNYGDAIPTHLNQYVDEILQTQGVTYVPGHGPIADTEAVEKYQEFLMFLQESATTAFQAGKSFKEASKNFKLPKQLDRWMVWSPENASKAYAAWYRELKKSR